MPASPVASSKFMPTAPASITACRTGRIFRRHSVSGFDIRRHGHFHACAMLRDRRNISSGGIFWPSGYPAQTRSGAGGRDGGKACFFDDASAGDVPDIGKQKCVSAACACARNASAFFFCSRSCMVKLDALDRFASSSFPSNFRTLTTARPTVPRPISRASSRAVTRRCKSVRRKIRARLRP